MSIKELLISIGLSKKEVKIYLSTIRMQPSKAKDIALMSEIARPTTYDILDTLKEKNLIDEFEVDGIKYFSAKDPSSIVQYIEDKARLFENYKKQAKNLLPELEILKYSESNRPEIIFLEPETAIKKLKSLIKESDECNIFFNVDSNNYKIQNMLKKISWNNTKFKILLPNTKENKIFKKEISHSSKILENSSSYSSDTFLFGDYMAIITYEPDIQITIIKNKNISATHSHIFNTLWSIN